ncbi:MAG: hypothetical protein Q7R79_03010, partial [bacterium]|nr:hypothetical protein [bacterium]
LAVPMIGWALVLMAALLLTILVSPLYVIYEILRYEDLMAVDRKVKFHLTQGMKVHLSTWAIIGLLFFAFSTYEGLLDEGSKQQFSESSSRFALPLIVEIKKNTETLSTYLEKLNITIPAVESGIGAPDELPIESLEDQLIYPE